MLKPPKSLVFSGEAGDFNLDVVPIEDDEGVKIGAEVTFTGDTLTIIPGTSGRRAAKELYKFFFKLLQYASDGTLPKE